MTTGITRGTARHRIAMDAHLLMGAPQSSGGTYLAALLEVWTRLNPDCEFLLLTPNASCPESVAALLARPQVKLIRPGTELHPLARYRAQLHWQQVGIPSLLRRIAADVFFSPFHLTPMLPWRQTVVTTIHDLCFLPEPVFSLGSLIHRAQVLSACWRARRLICVSQFTHRVLSRWSPRAGRKAVVVPNGITPRSLSEAAAHALLAQAVPKVTPGNYLFWIGHPSPRKNLELLLEVAGAHCGQHPSCRLVIVAPKDSHAEVLARARSHGAAEHLVLLDAVDATLRDALYRCALALVFPSRCEGFGYPIVEAMAQGCPAVAWEQSPAKELAGGVVRLARDLSVSAFCSLLAEYANLGQSERAILAKRLMERAQVYSSEAMAEGTLRVLREVILVGQP